MKISLILATINRTIELEIFLKSLTRQIYTDFELIVVDQNKDDRLITLVNKYKNCFPIKHIRCNITGLSRARNIGIHHINGDVIGFPDDDCEYTCETLAMVNQVFNGCCNIDGITGKHVSSFSQSNRPKKTKLNVYNVWLWSISFTIFLRKKVILTIGSFDVNLGVGSGTPYGSGEETDYLIRAIKGKFLIYHIPYLQVKHPMINWTDNRIYEKAYNYSVGRKYVLEKQVYSKWFIALNIIYPIIKAVFTLFNKRKTRYYWNQFRGRI